MINDSTTVHSTPTKVNYTQVDKYVSDGRKFYD